MLQPADRRGLNIRYSVVVLLMALLSGFAAFAGGAGFFRDTQAFLIVGALMLTVFVVSIGAPVRVKPAHGALGLLFLLYLLSSTTSIWRSESLLETGLIVGYLAVFFLGANMVGGERRRLATHALVLVGVVVAVWALYQFFVGYTVQIEFLRGHGYEEEARQLLAMSGQAFGNFPTANGLAGWLILLIPAALGLVMFESDRRIKLWLVAAAGVMAVALYFTFSRAALVALAMALIGAAVLWATRNGRHRRALMSALAGLPALGAIFYWVLFRFRYDAFMNAFSGRVDLWQAALAMAGDYPWLGIGPSGFGTALMQYQVGPTYSRYVHNSFLQVAAEVGWPGLLVLLGVLGLLFAGAWRIYKEADNRSAWQHLGLISGLTAAVIHNIFDYSLYLPAAALVFWWMAGLALGEDDAAPSAGGTPGTGRSVAALGLVVAILPFMLIINANNTGSTAQSVYDHYFFTHVSLSGGAQVASPPDEGDEADSEREPEAGRDGDHDIEDEIAVVSERYRRALRYFPYDSNLYDTYASVIYKESTGGRGGSLAEAAALQRRAIALRPTWPHYHLRLAEIYQASGKVQLARREYERAVSLAPMDPKFPVEFGSFLLRAGDKTAGLAVFRQAIALGKIYDRGYNISSLANVRGDQLNPLREIGRANIGAAYAEMELKRYARASKALVEAERLLGQTVPVLSARGRFWEFRGDFKRAVRIYRIAYRNSARANESVPGVKANPDPEIMVRLASALEKAGHGGEALSEARKVVAVNPRQSEARSMVERLESLW